MSTTRTRNFKTEEPHIVKMVCEDPSGNTRTYYDTWYAGKHNTAPFTQAGLESLKALRAGISVGDEPTPAANNPAALDYYPHQDDTKHAGPRAGTRTRKTTTYKVDGEHRAIWEKLNAEGRLDAGIEIKTSKDGLRAVLGAALHMCFTGEQEGWPVGKLFVNRPVTARVRDFVLRRTDVIIETREHA